MRAFLRQALFGAVLAAAGWWMFRPMAGPASGLAPRAAAPGSAGSGGGEVDSAGPFPIFRAAGLDTPATPGAASPAMDLNHADAAELESLPGIGPALAGRILEYRKAHGPFHHARELQRVRGIGPRKWERLRGSVAPP